MSSMKAVLVSCKQGCSVQSCLLCGLYYKHVTIVKYASSGVNKLKAELNDDARVVIYDHHMFILQATAWYLLCVI